MRLKQKRTLKRIISITLTAAMLSVGVFMPVNADEVVEDTDVQTGNTATTEIVTETEPQTEKETKTEPEEETKEEIKEDTSTEVETDKESDNTVDIIEAAGFTELDESIVLTEEQIESKQNLAEHIDEIDNCEAGEDYVDNQIVVQAEDYETAEAFADAYNASLEHYENGIALLELNPDDADQEELAEVAEIESVDMVSVAVCASADMDTNLPAAWPNYYDDLLDDDYDYSEFNDFTYEYNDAMLDGSNAYYQWHHEIVGSNAAWRAGYKGQGIKVAIIDSGMSAHEDITWAGGDRITDTGLITNDYTDNTVGHGTSVSGLIGAKGGNDPETVEGRVVSKGGVGIAPECTMYMLKVTDDEGSPNTYAEAVAVGRAGEVYGADVINISIGGPHYTEYFAKSVEYAYEKGIAVVCAAGNDSLGSAIYPASYTGAISVAATRRSGERASMSNFGPFVRYGAPGEKVCIDTLGSSYTDEGDGTSFSAPIISGMMAVLLGSGKVTGTGRKRVDNLLAILDKSCNATNIGVGKGIPNLAVALGLDTDLKTPGAVRASIPSGTYTDAQLTLELSTENSGAGHKDVIFYSDNGSNISFTNGRVQNYAKKYDPVQKIVVSGKRTTTIKAIAVNTATGLASSLKTFTYTLKPLVSDLSITTDTGHFSLQKSSRLIFTAKCTPSYAGNTSVTYAVTGFPADSEPKTRAYISGNILYTPANVKPGTYTVTCTSRDNGHYSESFDVTVTAPDRKVYSIAPKKTSLVMYSGIPEKIDISLKTIEGKIKYDDIAENYSIWSSSDPNIATASITGNELTITAYKAGRVTIKGVSNDGTKISRSISVTVRSHPAAVTIDPIAGGKVGVGKSVRLTASVLPADTYNKTVTWSIVGMPDGATTKTCATITASNGWFYATRAVPGIYRVKAVTKDNNNAGDEVVDYYDVEVYALLTKKITLGESSASIYRVKNTYNSPKKKSIEVFLDGGCYETLTVSGNNPGVVNGKLRQDGERIFLDVEATGGSVGSASITVKANDGTGKSVTIPVTVSNPPSYLELSTPSGMCRNIAKGRSVKLTAKFGTAYGKLTAATQKLIWTSSDTTIVTVNQNGVITGRANDGRSATITARTSDGVMSTSIYISSVLNTTGISTDGLWKLSRKPSGTYYGEYVNYLTTDEKGYISLTSVPIVNAGDSEKKSPIRKEYCDVSVNKEGLAVKWSTTAREAGKPNATVVLYANKPGTYYVTVKMRDMSSASNRIKVVVK